MSRLPEVIHESAAAHHDSIASSPDGSRNEKGELSQGLESVDTQRSHKELTQHVEHVATNITTETTFTTFDMHAPRVFGEDGEVILIPAPTRDPRDPMNLPLKQKLLGLGAMCAFGAMMAAAEFVLGAMLPIFALQYAGIDPGPYLVSVTDDGGFPQGFNPLSQLETIPNMPPMWHIYELATFPILMMGIANLFLIPLAIAIGRRPVLLGCGVISIGGALWAGFSTSLDSHIAARCIQAFGAGTVESLIPFMIQDVVHFHERNTWISGVFACQGLIIICLGISSPFIVANLSWHYFYFVTAAAAGFFLLCIFFLMPETRYYRTKAELSGIPRPDNDFVDCAPRTWRYNLAVQQGPVEWRKGWHALFDSLRTFFYPHIFFITMLNSAMIAAAFAATFTVVPQLISQPYGWAFRLGGLCAMPILISALFVGFISGKYADKVANHFAKKRGKRVPENQLINLVFPSISAILGCLFYGLAGSDPNRYPWAVFLMGLGMIYFGFLGANTVGAVYVLECYPQLAGPSLVNIASFRMLLAFVLSFKISDFIIDFGYLGSNMIYLGIISFFTALLPVIFFFGPAMRRRWPGPDRW